MTINNVFSRNNVSARRMKLIRWYVPLVLDSEEKKYYSVKWVVGRLTHDWTKVNLETMIFCSIVNLSAISTKTERTERLL